MGPGRRCRCCHRGTLLARGAGVASQGVTLDDLTYAVDRLIEHGRAFVALHILGLHIELARSLCVSMACATRSSLEMRCRQRSTSGSMWSSSLRDSTLQVSMQRILLVWSGSSFRC